MKYEDLSFTIKYDNGEELINDITGVVPNPENDEEPYVKDVLYNDFYINFHKAYLWQNKRKVVML